jgi:hypothetical protein
MVQIKLLKLFMTHSSKIITLLRYPKQANKPPIVEVMELPHNLNSTDEYFNEKGLRQLTEPTVRQTKQEISLFDQVVARYQKELDKLALDENFKPLYIGIRQAGDEIHVWALVDEKDDYTPQCLSRLEVEINRLFYNQNLLILTFYFYKGYHDCLVPSDDDEYVSLYSTATP